MELRQQEREPLKTDNLNKERQIISAFNNLTKTAVNDCGIERERASALTHPPQEPIPPTLLNHRARQHRVANAASARRTESGNFRVN